MVRSTSEIVAVGFECVASVLALRLDHGHLSWAGARCHTEHFSPIRSEICETQPSRYYLCGFIDFVPIGNWRLAKISTEEYLLTYLLRFEFAVRSDHDRLHHHIRICDFEEIHLCSSSEYDRGDC